jgi:hypothetical protein
MANGILPDRMKERPAGQGTVRAGVWLALSVAISGPTAADAPCPPQILTIDGGSVISGSKVCPGPAGESDTPDYDDPMATCSGLGGRRVVSVANASAFQQAMSNAACGDTIQLAAGNYSGSFSISKTCPMTSPVIIKGASGFQSTITSQFVMNGQSTIMTGVRVAGPAASVRFGGRNNKLLANKFTDWRTYAIPVITGEQGEIAYNEFFEPHPWLESEVGTYPFRMGIRTTEKDPTSFHYKAWVHHNYFHDFPEKPVPAQYDSGQSDAMEVCETGRASTAALLSGWYIESNLIERHNQGHGIVDLKCGGVVFRYNTVVDSPGGRVDIRLGSHDVIESNWMENSGGTIVHGGYNKIVGNYMRGGAGLTLVTGEYEWNVANTGHQQAYKALVAGNNTNALKIGQPASASAKFPATDTVIEAHSGSTPVLNDETNTVVRSTTGVKFRAPSRLASNEVGPTALARASPEYLECRIP